MSCEPEYTQYTICEWNVNLSNAKIHRNHRDQHLFEPGVNLMAKRQTRSDFRAALLLGNIIYDNGRIKEAS
jgi:hypothetical protein